MKANSTKRKIFDAVDLLTEDTSSQMPVKTMKGGVTMLDIDSIKPFHNHPFHLYEGDRLDDMVESIRDHGILNPVIVREIDDGYEMLSGHNRQKAAKIAGLKKIPAIIKYDLPDRVLPQDLSDYFFFGGERISGIANRTDLSKAVRGLMRLDVLENARDHIKEALKKFSSSIDTSGDSKAQAAQASLETAKKKLQQFIEAKDNAQAEMEHYQQQENEYNVQLSKSNVEQVKKAKAERDRIAFKLGLTFLICCLDSCLDFLNSSGIRLWNDEGDTVLRCSTID